MNNKRLAGTLLGTILSLALSSAAPAQGWYSGVFGGIGSPDLSTADFDAVLEGAAENSSLDDDSGAWGALAGYQWGAHVAMEIGYADLGRAIYRADLAGLDSRYSAKFESSGPTAAVLGILPLNDLFQLSARAGVIYSDTRITERVTDATGATVASNGIKGHAWDGVLGVGAVWSFSQRFALRLEYSRFLDVGDEDRTGEADVDLISLGLLFR